MEDDLLTNPPFLNSLGLRSLMTQCIDILILTPKKSHVSFEIHQQVRSPTVSDRLWDKLFAKVRATVGHQVKRNLQSELSSPE